MHDIRLRKTSETAIIVIFMAAVIFVLLKPISDPDVFWHLKTGEWIWQNKALPDKDPFTYTVESSYYESSVRGPFILKQYWLAQLAMYGIYKLYGFYGIVTFRCLVFLSIFAVLYLWIGKKGVSGPGRLMLLIPAVYISGEYLGERPNILSYLFAVMVVYLLDELRAKSMKQRLERPELRALNPEFKNKNYYLLPVVMLLWANMHGGFLLGDAIIIIYMLSELILFTAAKIRKSEAKISLIFPAVCLISVLVSFINPNTYKAAPMLLQLEGTVYSESIVEMASPFRHAQLHRYHYLIVIAVVMLVFSLRIRRLKLNAALLILLLVLLSLTRVRYIPFLLFISIPNVPDVWKGFLDRISMKGRFIKSVRSAGFYICISGIVAFAIFLFADNRQTTILSNPVIQPFFPEAAAEFIRKEKPEPEIFNTFGWGGYLIWALPEYKVFIDTRTVDPSVFTKYKKAYGGSAREVNHLPEWKAILEEYNVKTVLIIGSDVKVGGFVNLVRRLVEDGQWSLVFIDKEALLFLENTRRNREIISRYSVPKILAYEKALEQAEFYRTVHPDEWEVYATLGEINLYLGRPGTAIIFFEKAMEINPSLKSTNLVRLVEMLKAGRDFKELLK